MEVYMDDDELIEPQNDEPIDDPMQDGEDQEDGSSEPQLIGGKFKSQDDLLRAYQEIERLATEKTTVTKEVQKQLSAWGVQFDERTGAIKLPDNVTQPQTPPPDPEDLNQQVVDRLLSDPYSVMSEVVSASRKVQKQADANVESEVADLKSDPLYSKVAPKLKAQLAAFDDRILANPQQAKALVNNVYNQLVGDYTRQQAKTARDSTDPSARSQILESFGLTQSEVVAETGRNVLSQEDRDRMAAIGITDPKDQEAMAKAARKQLKEERNA
jgi:hypothetical protein